MSSRMVTFYDNLVAHLVADATLPELTDEQVLFVTGEADEDQIKAIDEHVQARVMRTKGIGVVIFEGPVTNEDSVSLDDMILAELNFEVRLFVHPRKWGQAYDPTKRKARAILEALVQSINGAQIAPAERGCQDATFADEFYPVPDPEFWSWNIEVSRRMTL